MKDMVKNIETAREETDLEWRPVLDGVHAHVDLRRLGRRLAAERHVTGEMIACLTGELERAIADVEKLIRERDEARADNERLRGALETLYDWADEPDCQALEGGMAGPLHQGDCGECPPCRARKAFAKARGEG